MMMIQRSSKAAKIQVQEGCSHKVIPVFFFPDLLLSAVKLNLKPPIYASSMKSLIFNIIFDTYPTLNQKHSRLV